MSSHLLDDDPPREGGRPYNEDKPDVPMRELVFGANSEGIVCTGC